MKYRPLGRSGLLVTELALETTIFVEQSQRSKMPQEAERIVHRLLEAGGNHIDTANVYAEGRSEAIIGASVIIGVRTLGQLEDNLAAIELQLSAQEIARLDEVSALEPGYPYSYLHHYGIRSY